MLKIIFTADFCRRVNNRCHQESYASQEFGECIYKENKEVKYIQIVYL